MSSPQHFECLEEEEITGHSNPPPPLRYTLQKFWRWKKLHGTQRYSNLKNRAVAIDKLRREVELRGSQTPP